MLLLALVALAGAPCTCDAGQACGMCLQLVDASECPTDGSDRRKCRKSSGLELFGLCEGDGECGTDDGHDNCPAAMGGGSNRRDVYRLESCDADGDDGSARAARLARLTRMARLPWLLGTILLAAVLMGALARAWLARRPLAASDESAAAGVQMETVLVPIAEVLPAGAGGGAASSAATPDEARDPQLPVVGTRVAAPEAEEAGGSAAVDAPAPEQRMASSRPPGGQVASRPWAPARRTVP
jgi:hypothetical protein